MTGPKAQRFERFLRRIRLVGRKVRFVAPGRRPGIASLYFNRLSPQSCLSGAHASGGLESGAAGASELYQFNDIGAGHGGGAAVLSLEGTLARPALPSG